jgi:hypothetical protein
MPEFDVESVRLGNLKDSAKIAEKIAASKASHNAAWLERAALNPLAGQVLAIGILSDTKVVLHGMEESELIDRFWLFYDHAHQNGDRLVGFNCCSFDLPFLVRRSWLLGVPVPQSVLRDNRYWSPTFVDLLDVWRMGNRQEYISQDELARALGVDGKPDGITGADFARLFNEDRPRAIEYLKNDLRMIEDIAKALQVV